MIKTVIHGAAGRMGCRLVALASAQAGLEVVAALESSDHPRLGDDAGTVAGTDPTGVSLTSHLNCAADVLIDFSMPAAAQAAVQLCLEQRIGLVMATTALDASQQELIRQAAGTIPIVWAPNMSLAVNLTMKLSEIAAGALSSRAGDVDVEIIERHHRFKEDAPSGTALRFGQMITEQMGQTGQVHGREGMTGPRRQDEIGYHAVRAGDHPGEHTIVFGLMGETIELRVGATNRDCYAQGALAAALFVAGKPPGLYNMFDVLGLH